MKFLVITDLHEKKSAVEWINALAEKHNVDSILFLGDVVELGSDTATAVNILKMFKRKVHFIPGNCDPLDLPVKAENTVHSVHGKGFEINGQYFAALGGSNPTIFNTPFELSEEEITEKLEKISKKGMVLMTHAPAYGSGLDLISAGFNVGSTAVKEIIEKYKPVAALSGHIHEAICVKEENGTLYVNPGAAKEGHAAILEINGNKASATRVGPAER